jgi:hypothetical protein
MTLLNFANHKIQFKSMIKLKLGCSLLVIGGNALSQELAVAGTGLTMGQGESWGQFSGESKSRTATIDLGGQVNRLISDQIDSVRPGLGRLYQALVSREKNFIEKEILNLAGEKSAQGLKSIFPSAQVNIGYNLDKNLEASVIGLQPLSNWKQDSNILHGWQSSLVVTDRRYTINNGYVYRRISEDRKFIYGLNSFIDLEFPYNHRRLSAGAEIKSTPLDLNFQHYIPLTSWIDGRNGIRETALRGSTFDVTSPIPYLPRLKFNVKYSRWHALEGSSNFAGMTYSLAGQITPNLTLSMSRRKIDGLEDGTAIFLSYSWTAGGSRKSQLPFISSTAYIERDMNDRMLEIVQRENTIRKQYSGLVVVTR